MKKATKTTLILVATTLTLVLVAIASFRLLPADFRGNRFLDAVAGNHMTCIRLLIWLGCDPNYMTGGGSAMHCAASKGNVALMQFLFSHGVKVDAPAKFRVTPLYLAREYHKPEAERFLLEHGANPDTSHIKRP